MFKVAVVGVGGISGAHIPAWRTLEDCKVVAICDIRQERLDMYNDVNKYLDFDEMLEKEEIDILDICLPTYLHVDFAVKAMNKGINVLCEKPISLKIDDVKRAYDTASKNGVNFMIAQVLRFWDEFEFVKNAYEDGRYGKLLSGVMSRIGQRPRWSWDNWMSDEKRSGLVPFDLHIHDLDYLTYAFGLPKDWELHRSKQPEQDYLNATYLYDGFFINVESAWYNAKFPFQASFRFQFEKAVVEYKNNLLKVYQLDADPIDFASAKALDSGNEGVPSSNAYLNEIIYFKDCCKNRVFPDKVKPEQLECVLKALTSF